MTKMSEAKTNGGNGLEHRRQEVQQAVNAACDQLNSDGVSPRDYVEQLAWLFYLKAFDEMEARREDEAAFDDEPYVRLLDGEFRWSSWSSRVDKADAMLKFVNNELWDKLQDMGDDTVGQRFRRIFSTVRNHSRRAASFAKVVQRVNQLHFSEDSDVMVLSEIYETLLKKVAADSAGYAGEFYTPRHIVRVMVEVINPVIRERIYDPCSGTCGFLGEAANFVRENSEQLGGEDMEFLRSKMFHGRELKGLSFLLGQMNMILHRIEDASLDLGDTLETHEINVAERDKFDVILSNPPYGGKLAETPRNFLVNAKNTECLFLQHIMTNLAVGGRAAVVVPEGVLFRGGPDLKVRKKLLKEFSLHTVLSLPAGVFLPYAGVKTNVIFFGRPKDDPGTKSVWFYELENDGFEQKTTRKPIGGSQVPDFLDKIKSRDEGDRSWNLSIEQIRNNDWNLSAKNPKQEKQAELRPALKIVQSLKAREERIMELLDDLEEMLSEYREYFDQKKIKASPSYALKNLGEITTGNTPSRSKPEYYGGHFPWVTPGDFIEKRIIHSREFLSDKGLIDGRARVVPSSSVLVVCIGATIGKVAVSDMDLAINQQINAVTFDEQKVIPEYGYWACVFIHDDIIRKASKSTMPIINKGRFSELKIPVPSKDIQLSISKDLNRIYDYCCKAHVFSTDSKNEITALRESILHRAFSGQL